VKNEKRDFPSKIFALGDIHGCREKLHALLKRVRIDFQNDTLIFLGDYIDRGRYSREVVEDILQLRQDKKNVICLLGNHEQMFLNYLDGVEEDLFLHNGGAFTLASYGISTADNLMQRKNRFLINIVNFLNLFCPTMKPSSIFLFMPVWSRAFP